MARIRKDASVLRVRVGDRFVANVREFGDAEGVGFVASRAKRSGYVVVVGAESVFITDRQLRTASKGRGKK